MQTLDQSHAKNAAVSQELTSKQKKRKQINEFYEQERAAKKAARGPQGVGRYMGREGIAAASSSYVSPVYMRVSARTSLNYVKLIWLTTRAGPSTIAIPVNQARELVQLLPVPEDVAADPARYRLVEDMRTMVAGKAVLNEAQRAYVPPTQHGMQLTIRPGN